jgi:hypothetical protein
MGTSEECYCIFLNDVDDGSPQNTTPPIGEGLSLDKARGLADALNGNGYLRQGLFALVGNESTATPDPRRRP